MKTIKIFSFLAFMFTVPFSSFSLDKTGQVYLMRATGYTGAVINYRLYIDNQLACKLKKNPFLYKISVPANIPLA
ncbi:hypothetical protein HDE68_004915 [Pedobacter cryoconitis]|uniref:Uncharacterized protein n=1 Tax=Pedobacter cryoconitis TaxID=188932 RepID=A0A7W9E101_9SPHI|nr:hypothetical protein [Pedobacter cryoconitis]MBB5638977.1 hypothetical protein [Pedobacter cryoconitis]